VADGTLYLFDGYNALHAGPYADARELADALASFVASHGVRGVLVFDGVGDDAEVGPLSIRFAPDADTLLERLAAEHRGRERVVLVSSDSQTFFRDLEPPLRRDAPPGALADKLDVATRARLERLRRGE
jgi:hypothetical protein